MNCDIFVQYLFSIYFHEYFMEENLRHTKLEYINNRLRYNIRLRNNAEKTNSL